MIPRIRISFLAPLDGALIRPVQDAGRDKIPVIIIDSGLQGRDYISFVATDNYQGGVLAARRMGEQLSGKGRIFMVRYLRGEAIPDRVDTGVTLVTKEIMDTPEIKTLLSPDLSILDR